MKIGVILAFIGANSFLGASVEFQVEDDVLRVMHGECATRLSLGSPTLLLDADLVIPPAAPRQITGSPDAEEGLRVVYAPVPLPEGVIEEEVRVCWYPEEEVLRKWARMRISETSTPRTLLEAALEELDVSGMGVTMRGVPPQSYPAFWSGFFAGIEYPVAASRIENGQLVLAHRPGVRLEPGAWYETRKAVYGMAEPGGERDAFMQYVAKHRPAPQGLHFNYNSWWTSSVPFTEEEILGLMKSFHDNLYVAQGAALDTFAIDMGWSRANSLWEIDTALFPEGFTKIGQAAQGMGGRAGPMDFSFGALCSGSGRGMGAGAGVRDVARGSGGGAPHLLFGRPEIQRRLRGATGPAGETVRHTAREAGWIPAGLRGKRSWPCARDILGRGYRGRRTWRVSRGA